MPLNIFNISDKVVIRIQFRLKWTCYSLQRKIKHSMIRLGKTAQHVICKLSWMNWYFLRLHYITLHYLIVGYGDQGEPAELLIKYSICSQHRTGSTVYGACREQAFVNPWILSYILICSLWQVSYKKGSILYSQFQNYWSPW